MSVPLGALPQAQGSNVLIVYDNRLIGRKGTTISSDSEAAGTNMVDDNLLSEQKGDYWRSGSVATRSGAGTPEIITTYTLSTPRDFNWVSYHWSNNLLPWRADFYRNSLLVGTTDWMNPLVQAEPTDFADPGEFPWRLGPSLEKVAAMAEDMQLQSYAHLSEVLYGVDEIRWRYDCTEGANGAVDYVQTSLHFGGRAWQPHFNMKLGAELVPVMRSDIRRKASGEPEGTTRRVAQEIKFALDLLPDQEGVELFSEWLRDETELGRVFVIQKPGNLTPPGGPHERRHFYDKGAFVGTAESFDAISIDYKGGHSDGLYVTDTLKGIKIQEI